MPSAYILANCFGANEDGFGIAYSPKSENTVYIRKGAMSKSAMRKLFTKLPDLKEAQVVMHFRNATDGEIVPGNCHPYPLTGDRKLLRATNLQCGIAVAHNGIIPKKLVKDAGLRAKFTDTQQYIMDYMVRLGRLVLDLKVGVMIQSHAGGKFAVLSPNKIVLIGDFTEDDGVFYSNSSYKVTKTVVTVATKYQYALGGYPGYEDYNYPYVPYGAGAKKEEVKQEQAATEPKPTREVATNGNIVFLTELEYCDLCGKLVHCICKIDQMQMCYACYTTDYKGGEVAP